MLLAGDIGGTKTVLAVYAPNGGLSPQIQESFKSTDYPDLKAIVLDFLADVGIPVDKAVFGVAGSVVDGEVRVTNLSWIISEVML